MKKSSQTLGFALEARGGSDYRSEYVLLLDPDIPAGLLCSPLSKVPHLADAVGGKQGWVEAARYLLHHHLRYNVERGEAGVGKALLVLAHLDGL